MIGLFEIEIALIQLEHPDVLNLGITAEIIFLDACMHAITVALAARDVDRVAINNIFLRRRILAIDIDIILSLYPALDPSQRLVDFFLRHSPVILLEEIRESILERLPSPGGLRDCRCRAQADTAQEVSASLVKLVAGLAHGSSSTS